MLAIIVCGNEQASAQYFGGYGAGFTPSPQALYGPNGANTGALYPNGYVQGYGYAPPQPMYNYGYGGMGYGGGYGYQRMSLGQAIVTSAAIVAISNSNRGYYGSGYGYQQPYNARGYRGGYGGFHHYHR